LVVIEGPEMRRVFEFTGYETFRIVRAPDARLRLSTKARRCSRLHFMVELNPPLCRLWNLVSRNGTQVNRRRGKGQLDLRDRVTISTGHKPLRGELPSVVPSEPAVGRDGQ
jgi:serine/threonine-protein kinase